MKTVHHEVLLPIFKGALQKGLLQSIPSYDQVLETAHILPSAPDKTPPIIARFYSRNIKALIFRLKRDYATKLPPSTTTQTKSRPSPPKPAHPFFEDLTTANYRKMKAIANDNRVMSCWSVAGQLRLRLNGEERVRRVHNIYDSIDTIINSTSPTPSSSSSSTATTNTITIT